MLPNRSFRPGWNLGLGYSYQQNNLTTIQELSPNANTKSESKKANKQANQDMRAAESQS
jgi:hypothetical protein